MACDEATEALQETILEALAKPKRVRGDAGEVEMHSIKDQLSALDRLKNECAASRPARGIRITKLIPEGDF